MRIAFYAPLKPPDHPVASGDRAMARGLIAALQRGGHEVEVPSRFRSFDAGDAARQERIRAIGAKLGDRLIRRYEKAGTRPHLWFTYHLYHKAPDWLGPKVAGTLGIPYVLAEASFAPKQAEGRWRIGHRAAEDSIRRADRVFQLNPADAECVLPLLRDSHRLVRLTPFVETAPFREIDRAESRSSIARSYGVPEDAPWLLTVAMMRNDQKLLSYHCMAAALGQLLDLPWRLIVVGAGPAEAEVRAAFAPLAERMTWTGVTPPETLRRFYRASDLYLWPAIKEAYGIALLEAQAAGLPVVAGRSGGIASIVADGETGRLTAEGDVNAFADPIRSLVLEPERMRAMGDAAARKAIREHDIGVASALLDRTLRELVAERVA